MKAPDLHTPWSLGSTEQNHRRWGIWEVHQADYPEPPFYVLMPEYGQWNTATGEPPDGCAVDQARFTRPCIYRRRVQLGIEARRSEEFESPTP
jgi:hypothetical protein